MKHDDKRQMRKLKRDVKKAGNKRRRLHFKRALHDSPEEAHEAEFEFGRDRSESLNGMDRDSTRRQAE